MKKITTFLIMSVLCCSSVFAQTMVETELPTDKMVRIGTAQAEMVPGKWYFVHNTRPVDGQATNPDNFALVGGIPNTIGGFVEDKGTTQVGLSSLTTVESAMSDEGVSIEEYKSRIVRFVAVEGKEGAFNVQFGTGNWFSAAPADGTVSNNQYIAGLAGEYNFYLVKNVEGEPNTAGRFAWNKYNMGSRVDVNKKATLVTFWSSGELTSENLDNKTHLEERGDAGIVGNNVWQIYDIEVLGEVDHYQQAVNSLVGLSVEITSIEEGQFLFDLIDGINVGNSYGNYKKEYVDAFLALNEEVEELMYSYELDGIDALKEKYPTADDIISLTNNYRKAYNDVINNKVPTSLINVASGYYTINSMMEWFENVTDTVFYTQEQADSVNNANGFTEGVEGYVVAGDVLGTVTNKIVAPIKSLCSRDNNGKRQVAWGTKEPKADYLWKIEAVEGKPTEYRLINMFDGTTFTSIATSTNVPLVSNDTATVCFDWREDNAVAPFTGDSVTSFSIRCSNQAEGGSIYAHCGGHASGAGKQGWIVGWSDAPATRWYLSSVDEATANQWIAEGDVSAQFAAKISKADSIASVVSAQILIAKDESSNVSEADSVVTDPSQFYSNKTVIDGTNGLPAAVTTPEETYALLIDGNSNTYWVSDWQNAAPKHTHYLQVEAPETFDGVYAVKLLRRTVNGNHVTKLAVRGYDENNPELTFEDGEDFGVINLPFGGKGETVVSTAFTANGKAFVRFYFEESVAAVAGGAANQGFFHACEFNVLKATVSTNATTTQYEVRKAEIQALEAAVAAWDEKGYSADSIALMEDETFNSTYEALIAAYDAWSKVYVDPSALRTAIATLPSSDLFVIGSNPGQWKEVSTAISEITTRAKEYDNSGKYTPAESQALIDAIEEAISATFASANKVETGKWYRFKFPSEEMYDTYKWNKSGAKNLHNEVADMTTSPALFGKTVAVGTGVITYHDFLNEEGESDTLAIYSVEESNEWYDGDQLYFFEDAEFSEGEDLFQFIAATDTSYVIQNKATGLFLRNGHPATLSAIPSYWNVDAIGAGANAIGSTDIFGVRGNFMHGQRSDNALVTWNANTVSSNSMIMIEEVEAVIEAPSNEYQKKIWPGMVNMITMPVEISVVDGATAYGAELVLAEDTSIVLKSIVSETISAGTPFILIAEAADEYVTKAESLEEKASQIYEEKGQYGRVERQLANSLLNDEYAVVTMEHGMEVDTIIKPMLSMVGTFKSVEIPAGKGVVAEENGFKHTYRNTTIGAYSAYIASDFNPESEDILSSLEIKIEGEIESSVNEVLSNVAKTGNIYTVGGQYVGKGNINTVNNLPSGIYIVNGVKVIKR